MIVVKVWTDNESYEWNIKKFNTTTLSHHLTRSLTITYSMLVNCSLLISKIKAQKVAGNYYTSLITWSRIASTSKSSSPQPLSPCWTTKQQQQNNEQWHYRRQMEALPRVPPGAGLEGTLRGRQTPRLLCKQYRFVSIFDKPHQV